MKSLFTKVSIIAFALFVPVIVMAQASIANYSGTPPTIAQKLIDLIVGAGQVIGAAIPAVIGLAVLGFMWGIAMYLFGRNKEEGKKMMIWGIVALFVMTSVWGLVGILRSTLGVGTDNATNVRVPGIERN